MLRQTLVERRRDVEQGFRRFLDARPGPWQERAREGLRALAQGDDFQAAQRLREATRLWVAPYVRRGTLVLQSNARRRSPRLWRRP
jgi:hypothetical protein